MEAAWRAVESAVWASGGPLLLTIERVERVSPYERVFHLVGARGEPATVRFEASRLEPHMLPSSRFMSFEVRVGRFGEADRERRLRESLLRFRPKHDL